MLNKWVKRSILFASATILAACSNGEESTDSGVTEDGKTKFSVATVRWSDWGEDFLDGFIENTEEEANVEIDWDIYIESDWGDQKGVLMAGGDLPDAFLGSITINDSDIAQFSESFVPLNDLIKENMPNLVRAMEEDPLLEAVITSPDGQIYSLPTKLPMRPESGNQMFINQQWLDNLGLDMPDTYEDFMEVLKAFRDEDANGNGDASDEIPFGGGYADPVLSFTLPFGTTMSPGSRSQIKVDENGSPVYIPTAEFYRDGVEWMHEAYAENLIDPELFTQDASMADGKRQNQDIALVGVSVGWTSDVLFGPHAAEYVPLKPLQGPDGERYVHSDSEVYSRNELVITTNAKDPAAILKWADLFYTEDASIQTFYGSFGVATEKNDDGTYTVLESPDGDADTFAWVNSLRDFGPKYISDGFNDKVIIDDTKGDGLKLKLDNEIKEYVGQQYPSVMYTDVEQDRLSLLGVDIGSYVQSKQAEWVTEGGVAEEWDEYIDTLNQMGLEEFLQIQYDGYARHITN